MKNVIVLKKFKDLVEGVDREIGSTFSVEDKRADLLVSYALVKVCEASEKETKPEVEKTNVTKTTTVKKPAPKRTTKKTTAKKTTVKKPVAPKGTTSNSSTPSVGNVPENPPVKE